MKKSILTLLTALLLAPLAIQAADVSATNATDRPLGILAGSVLDNDVERYSPIVHGYRSGESPADFFKRAGAKWVQVKYDENQNIHQVCYRTTFELKKSGGKSELIVTAQTLYRLYINGEFVAFGPARASEESLFVDHFDISAYLRDGKNVIAMEVTDYSRTDGNGAQKFVPQIYNANHASGFALAAVIADGGKPVTVVSGSNWRQTCWHAYDQQAPSIRKREMQEVVDTGRVDWDWKKTDYDDSKWQSVNASQTGDVVSALRWRPIPYHEYRQHLPVLVHDVGVLKISGALGWPTRHNVRQETRKPTDPAVAFVDQLVAAGEFSSGTDQNLVRNPGNLLQGANGELTAQTLKDPKTIPYVVYDLGEIVGGLPSIEAYLPKGTRVDIAELQWVGIDNGEGTQWRNRLNGNIFPSGQSLIGSDKWVSFESVVPTSCRYLVLLFRGQADQPIRVRKLSLKEVCSIPTKTRAGVTCSDPLLNRIVAASLQTMRTITLDWTVDCTFHENVVYTGEEMDSRFKANYLFHGDASIMGGQGVLAFESKRIDERPGLRANEPLSMAPFPFASFSSMSFFADYMAYTARNLPESVLALIRKHAEWYATKKPWSYVADENGFLINGSGWFAWNAISMLKNDPQSTQDSIQVAGNAHFYYALTRLYQSTGDTWYRDRAQELQRSLTAIVKPFIMGNGSKAERLVPDVFTRDKKPQSPDTPKQIWKPLEEKHRKNFAQNTPARSIVTSVALLYSGILTPDLEDRLWEVVRDWDTEQSREQIDHAMFSIPSIGHPACNLMLHYAKSRGDAEAFYREVCRLYGPMVVLGNTLWETTALDSRSGAHFNGIYPGPALFESLTGIYPTPGQGYRQCRIEPLVDGSLRWARGYLELPEGIIGVNWESRPGVFTMQVTIPKGVKAKVKLPDVAVVILHNSKPEQLGTTSFDLKEGSTRISVNRGEGLQITTL